MHTNDPVEYKLELTATTDATGYFSCRSAKPLVLEEIIDHLRVAPMDEFMHKALLHSLSEMPEKDLTAFFQNCPDENDPFLLAACCEAGLTKKVPLRIRKQLNRQRMEDLTSRTPLIILKSKTMTDYDIHQKWIPLFRNNMIHHKPFPPGGDLPRLFDSSEFGPSFNKKTDIAAIHARHAAKRNHASAPLPFPSETAQRALDILEQKAILNGNEMRHESSLSPYALLRRWNLDLSVSNGRHHYRLSGIQTSYGRGLSLDSARASNLMEVIERFSSFAGFHGDRATGYKKNHKLVHGSLSSLIQQGLPVLDPNLIRLEAPYKNEKLYWIGAETTKKGKTVPIWIPAQTVFPFCNLDEPCLFSGLGSTGLASGNTMAQAKVSALLEVLERDAEATVPYVHSLCFRVESDDPEIAMLLDAYKKQGIDVVFQDLTSGLGVPCCKCFVKGQDGTISKGVGAHLCAKKALISAMTETPYPFPGGPPSMQASHALMIVPLEKLPDYTTGAPETDLAILEEILKMNHYQPLYVDLTRTDINLPVVRAIVPGLEIMADFDEFSRVSPRLYFNYMTHAKKHP